MSAIMMKVIMLYVIRVNVIMMSAFGMNIIMMSAFGMNVIMLSVALLSIVSPKNATNMTFVLKPLYAGIFLKLRKRLINSNLTNLI